MEGSADHLTVWSLSFVGLKSLIMKHKMISKSTLNIWSFVERHKIVCKHVEQGVLLFIRQISKSLFQAFTHFPSNTFSQCSQPAALFSPGQPKVTYFLGMQLWMKTTATWRSACVTSPS